MRLPVCRLSVLMILPVLLCISVCAEEKWNGWSFHEVKTDAQGMILPWYSSDYGIAFAHAVTNAWGWRKKLGNDRGGVRYHMTHQVWSPSGDGRGVAGLQFAQMLGPWILLYACTGDQAVIGDMTMTADIYLDNGLSGPNAAWPNLPFPYSTDVNQAVYDGDMKAGKGVT